MSFLLRLALRNLQRHKRRTIITSVAIAAGVSLTLLVHSFLTGVLVDSERNLVLYETSGARVHAAGYWADREHTPIDIVIEQPGPLVSAIQAQGFHAAPRVVLSAELIVPADPYPESGTFPVQVAAIDPDLDDTVFPLSQHVDAGGSYLRPGQMEAMLGSWLAADMGAKVGYPLTLVLVTREGFRQTIDLTIAGFLTTPDPMVNRGLVLIPLDVADLMLQMNGAVTEISVDLGFPVEQGKVANLRSLVAGSFPGHEVYDYQQINASHAAMLTAEAQMDQLILVLIFIIAAVGISNTMMMSVYERFREIGMMRSLGLEDGTIKLLFFFESMGIGAFGSLIGLILGIFMSLYAINVGFDFSEWVRQIDIGYRITGVYKGAWNIPSLISVPLLSMMFCALPSLLVTRRAFKKTISESLR